MSSGIRFTENYSGRDDASKLVANTLRQQTQGGADTVLEFKQREAPAGTRFRYASADSQVLGLVLIAAVKQPLAEYLSEKIWQPMGAEANATWLLDKGGYETGYCCINATLRDYARFGMLLANYGALDGKQIIPAEWVKAATTAQAPHLARRHRHAEQRLRLPDLDHPPHRAALCRPRHPRPGHLYRSGQQAGGGAHRRLVRSHRPLRARRPIQAARSNLCQAGKPMKVR